MIRKLLLISILVKWSLQFCTSDNGWLHCSQEVTNHINPYDYGTQALYLSEIDLDSLKNKRIPFKTIKLGNDTIRELKPGCLNSVSEAIHLTISDHILPKLIPGIFNSMIYMEELNLMENGIEEISNHTFTGMNSLKKLNISRNKLTEVGKKWFDRESKLTVLDISENLITDLENDSFEPFPLLEKLFLNNNKLKVIPPPTVRSLRFLQILNLSHNSLESFPEGFFDFSSNLETLDISYNKLKEIDQIFFAGLSNLKMFYINHNQLTNFDLVSSEIYLSHLQIISLDSNNWSCNKLLKIILQMKKLKTTIEFGNENIEENRFGIKCSKSNDQIDTENYPKLTNDNLNLNNDKIESKLNLLHTYLVRIFGQGDLEQRLHSDNKELIQTTTKEIKGIANSITTLQKYISKILGNEDLVDRLNRSQKPNIVIKPADFNDTAKMEKLISEMHHEPEKAINYTPFLIILILLLIVCFGFTTYKEYFKKPIREDGSEMI